MHEALSRVCQLSGVEFMHPTAILVLKRFSGKKQFNQLEKGLRDREHALRRENSRFNSCHRQLKWFLGIGAGKVLCLKSSRVIAIRIDNTEHYTNVVHSLHTYTLI